MKKAILSTSFILILFSYASGQGIFNASIHQATPFGNVDSPAAESAQQVIDQDPETKFLDLEKKLNCGKSTITEYDNKILSKFSISSKINWSFLTTVTWQFKSSK